MTFDSPRHVEVDSPLQLNTRSPYSEAVVESICLVRKDDSEGFAQWLVRFSETHCVYGFGGAFREIVHERPIGRTCLPALLDGMFCTLQTCYFGVAGI